MDKIKKLIRKFSQNSQILYRIYKWLVNSKRAFYFRKYQKKYALEEKTIVFEAFQGRLYACSPKAMYLAALEDERFKDYTFIWSVRNMKKYAFLKKNRNTKLVKYCSYEYMQALAKAKYWVVNSTLMPYLAPKKEQVFIQTWHGTPLKRLGCDIQYSPNKSQKLPEVRRQYHTQESRISYFISPSKFYTEKIASAYDVSKENISKKFIECGYPRNDFLFSYTDEDVKRVKEKLGIPEDKKVLLYAPTFRDDTHERGKGFHYEIGIDFDLLMKELSEDFVILFRAHYFIIDKYDLEKYKGFIYNVSKYDDINELYIISDMLLTDYSSVFFDFANLKRPVMFFMYDYDAYKNKLRDFYLELSELPGPIVYENRELCDMIRKTEKEFSYDEKYQKFNERFNTYNDENSSKRALGECILNG